MLKKYCDVSKTDVTISYLSFVLHTLFSFQGAISEFLVEFRFQYLNFCLNTEICSQFFSDFLATLIHSDFCIWRGAARSIKLLYMQVRATKSNQKLVGLNGLEPSTSRLSGGRSNLLSYKPIFFRGCLLARVLFSHLVEIIGIEPMTPCLQSRCSPS